MKQRLCCFSAVSHQQSEKQSAAGKADGTGRFLNWFLVSGRLYQRRHTATFTPDSGCRRLKAVHRTTASVLGKGAATQHWIHWKPLLFHRGTSSRPSSLRMVTPKPMTLETQDTTFLHVYIHPMTGGTQTVNSTVPTKAMLLWAHATETPTWLVTRNNWTKGVFRPETSVSPDWVRFIWPGSSPESWVWSVFKLPFNRKFLIWTKACKENHDQWFIGGNEPILRTQSFHYLVRNNRIRNIESSSHPGANADRFYSASVSPAEWTVQSSVTVMLLLEV